MATNCSTSRPIASSTHRLVSPSLAKSQAAVYDGPCQDPKVANMARRFPIDLDVADTGSKAYRELCEREAPVWRWLMPLLIAALLFAVGIVILAVSLRNAGLL